MVIFSRYTDLNSIPIISCIPFAIIGLVLYVVHFICGILGLIANIAHFEFISLLFIIICTSMVIKQLYQQLTASNNNTVLYISVISVFTADFYEIPVFWIRVFDVLMLRLAGYGIYKITTTVAYKLFPAFADWWDLSRGVRIFAIRLKIEDRLANIFHPGSCQIYLFINLVATYGLNLMCFYILENTLFFIQATVGFFVFAYRSARSRAIWGYFIPFVYFLIIYLKTKGYIVITDWCPNNQYSFCSGDGTTGGDGTPPSTGPSKPSQNDATVSPAPAARSGWRDVASVATSQAQESFNSNRPGLSKTLQAAGEKSHAVGTGLWVFTGCVVAISGFAYAGKQVSGLFRGTGKVVGAAGQQVPVVSGQPTSITQQKPLTISKPPVGRTEAEKQVWAEQNREIRKLQIEERDLALVEKKQALAQRRGPAGQTVFEGRDGTAMPSKPGPGAKVVSSQITVRTAAVAGRFATGLLLGRLTSNPLAEREAHPSAAASSRTGSGTSKR